MTQRRSVAVALAFVFVAVCSYSVRADVRADEKTRFEFAGLLGKFVNVFAGKAAKDGVTSTVAVKGDRAARINENDGQIIDLAEEKIYELDMKKKSYKVTTFAEIRRRMEEAQRKMQEEARKSEAKAPAQADAKDQKEPNVEIDFSLKNTGEKKTINGFETRQEVMTIAVREKGKTLEQAGGLVLTSDMWIAPRIPAMKEVQDFYLRFAQKLYGNRNMLAGADANQMATMMAMYPMMKQAIAKMNTEGERLQGTPILTTMTFDAVKSEEQLAQEAKAGGEADSKKGPPTSVGGLLGGFGKKIAAKKAGGGADEGAKPRTTILTGSTEVLKVVTEVSPSDVAVPAGFKETK